MGRWYWWALGLLLLSGGGYVAYKAKGLRNNNPGNIRAVAGQTWVGQIGQDGDGFAIFDNEENGIRAMVKLLRKYYATYGLHTIGAIINRWAPSNENDTASYAAAVSRELGMPVDKPLTNIELEAEMSAIVAAIIRHENGMQPYSLATINSGIQRAAA